MHIPTDQELQRLAFDSVPLHAALTLHRQGLVSFEDALRIAVAILVDQAARDRQALIDALMRVPPPAIRSLD